jgi:metal-responsive CopG/Arc/MetJ family transcriptional regulator
VKLMLRPTIKLNNELWAKVKKCSEAGGYSSPQEFVEHVLEKELKAFDETESDEEITRKLKGLGYLD